MLKSAFCFPRPMTAKILDGNAIATRVRAEWKVRAAAVSAAGCRPGLAVAIVGENPASRVYVRSKVKACAELGLYSELHELPAMVEESRLIALIQTLNRKPEIHGILVQLPLPAHIDRNRVLAAIAPEKDVDGFHLENAGGLMTGNSLFPPCTPFGVMQMLAHENIPIRGQHAVIVGASNIVGKPMAMMLLQEGATVTICNSKTRDLGAMTRQADILVVATGKPGLVKGDMVKPGAAVIDVGINRMPDGKLAGDVDFSSSAEKAAYITPVPGGVGPMTITMLLVNTIRAAERACTAQRLSSQPAVLGTENA
jgi:methylenetetrahydrofolate dehydrogenase (NADP+) / methenyltetrahydrofolate cyclohydrolase